MSEENRKMPNLVKYLIALMVFVALGAAGGFLARDFLTQPTSGSQALTPGDRLQQTRTWGETASDQPRNKVSAIGRLEPQGEVIEIGGVMGDRLKSLEVEESQVVEAGAILGYLESYDQSQAAVDVIEGQLVDARARLAAETEYAKALIKQAEVGQREAVELGPLRVRVQEAKVRIAEAQSASAQKDWQRLQGVSGDTITQQARDHQQLLVRQANEQLAAEQAGLNQANTALELNQAQANAKLAEARANLDRVKSAVPIASLEKQRAAAKVAVDRTILKAPTSGQILQINIRPGEPITQMPILTMGDTSVMYAVAEVYETDVSHVAEKQRAVVSSKSLQEKLEGEVSQIGLMVGRNQLLHFDPTADVDARVVEVLIRLDDSKAASRLTNLQVDVEIYVQ
jgi:HlyD family secretion protein